MRSNGMPAALVAVALAAGACGGNGGEATPKTTSDPGEQSSFDTNFAGAEAYPVFASSEIVVGENRFLVGILNQNDAPIGSPDLAVHISFYELSKSETAPVFEADTQFIETVPGARGLYVANVSFPRPGRWGAEVAMSGDGIDETVRAGFEVRRRGTTPAVGDPAPATDSPTIADVEHLDEITTDPHPDRNFYELSIAGAVRSGRPSVIVFATPKFCTSQVCGPTLEIVKGVSKDFPKVNFVHVEVYSNLDDPSNLKVVPAVKKWGLPSEPWVFVVDARGHVAAKFEGSVSPGELTDTLRKL